MSENGPREGTRDLPRRSPEAGFKSVEEDSATGVAYARLARRERRRKEEIQALAEEGLTLPEIAARYARDHPLERGVSPEEFPGTRSPPSAGSRRARRA